MTQLDDLFERHPMRPTVEARIRRLNPRLREGDRLRGYYRKPAPWRLAKKRWQAGVIVHFPFMAPGGKRVVNPWLENCSPGHFIKAKGDRHDH